MFDESSNEQKEKEEEQCDDIIRSKSNRAHIEKKAVTPRGSIEETPFVDDLPSMKRA